MNARSWLTSKAHCRPKTVSSASMLSYRGRQQVTRERVLLQRLLYQHGKPVHALSHVGVTERQVHFHARRNDHHGAIPPLSTRTRAASGSLPTGRRHAVRRPSQRPSFLPAVAQVHEESALPPCRRRARPAQASRASSAPRRTLLASGTSPVTIPCLRATPETVAPGCPLSIAIASFCSSLKKRQAGVAGARGTSSADPLKLLSEPNSLALVLTTGRAEG